MIATEKGRCPYYKYKPKDSSEKLSCAVTGEFIEIVDSDSLTKIATIIEETCLGFEYKNCPNYKKGIKKL